MPSDAKYQDVGIHNACPLTHKQLETHGCVLRIAATGTDVLVLKHQATSIRSTEWIFIVSDQFYTKLLRLNGILLENN